MSLDSLIDLARVTGDRLIVHNPLENKDVVLMSVDEYENLIDRRKSVRGMSSGELLDQINRDISVWRSDREQDEEWERTMELEDEIIDEEIDPFSSADWAEFSEASDLPFGAPWEDDWHHVGRVLEDKRGYDFEDDLVLPNGFGQTNFIDEFEEDEEGEDEIDWNPPHFDGEDKETARDRVPDFDFSFDDRVEDEIKVEDIPFDPPLPVAFGEAEPLAEDMDWAEEPLPSEEPVFYEEPV